MRTTLPSSTSESHDALPVLRDDAFFALLEGGFGRKRCNRRTEKKRRIETARHKKGRTQSNGNLLSLIER